MKEYEISIEEVLADQPDLLRALRAVQQLQRERQQLQQKDEVTK